MNDEYDESENEEEGDYLVDHWDDERDEFEEEGNEGRDGEQTTHSVAFEMII